MFITSRGLEMVKKKKKPATLREGQMSVSSRPTGWIGPKEIKKMEKAVKSLVKLLKSLNM